MSESGEKIVRLAKKLAAEHNLTDGELLTLIGERSAESALLLKREAQAVCRQVYGNKIFIRGLIEFTNYCKNDCCYCGIRKSNRNAERYRLDEAEILSCCEEGYSLGFRTFVLQGGEDGYYSDERLCGIVAAIRSSYPDCAVTLSVGERSRDSYRRLYEAGAERYLLRHETADKSHYESFHPVSMQFANRMKCLENLREIGYQTGCGFMVGSPHQTMQNIVQDLRFIKKFRPQMVGIGPFLSHKDTPFRNAENGSVELTLYLLSVVRLMLPEVLLPATTALGTASDGGREAGILCGANVVMPNLSPAAKRKKYMLYDNKLSDGLEAAESLELLRKSLNQIGYEIAVSRGDSLLI